MKTVRYALLAMSAVASATAPARASCQFSPSACFPDRNDAVDVEVVTETGHGCTMAVRGGLDTASLAPRSAGPRPMACWPRRVPTAFLYLPFDDYKSPDSCGIKLCAIVQGHRGCSSLTCRVDVQ